MVTSGERTRERNPQGEGPPARRADRRGGAPAGRGRRHRFALTARRGAGSRGRRAIGLSALLEQGGSAARGGGRALRGIATGAIETAVASGHDPASRLLAGCLAYCRYATTSQVPTSCCSTPRDRTSKTVTSPAPRERPPSRRSSTAWPPARGWGGAARRPVPHRDRYLVGAPRDSLTAPGNAGSPGRRWKTRCAAYWRRSLVSPTGIAPPTRR